jgi:hypothetical protein
MSNGPTCALRLNVCLPAIYSGCNVLTPLIRSREAGKEHNVNTHLAAHARLYTTAQPPTGQPGQEVF